MFFVHPGRSWLFLGTGVLVRMSSCASASVSRGTSGCLAAGTTGGGLEEARLGAEVEAAVAPLAA